MAHPLTGRIPGFGRICGCPIPLRCSAKGGGFRFFSSAFCSAPKLHACGSVFGTGTGQLLPPFANPPKSGAPARTKTKLQSNLPEWYHPHRSAANCENHGDEAEKHGPPAYRSGDCGSRRCNHTRYRRDCTVLGSSTRNLATKATTEKTYT